MAREPRVKKPSGYDAPFLDKFYVGEDRFVLAFVKSILRQTSGLEAALEGLRSLSGHGGISIDTAVVDEVERKFRVAIAAMQEAAEIFLSSTGKPVERNVEKPKPAIRIAQAESEQ